MSAISLGKPRLSVAEYITLCQKHFVRNWMHYTIPLAVVFLLQFFVRFDVNYTESLPDHAFVTIKGWKSGLKHGDYVAYAFPTENPVSPFRKGDHMVKIVGGTAGDEVRKDDEGNFSILKKGAAPSEVAMGGPFVGNAKPKSMTGKPLEAGPTGIIPTGRYYVMAPHKDSLDSRYAIVGWISDGDIIGRTFPLF